MEKRVIITTILLGALVIMTSCQTAPTPLPTVTPMYMETVNWMIDDAVNQSATQIVREVENRIQTALPTTIPTATNTSTPVVQTPTVTSAARSSQNDFERTKEAETSCVDAVKFVKDITIPDGSSLAPDETFTKTWQIRNVGTCVWNDQYSVIFQSGELMSGKKTFSLPDGITVEPDGTIDLSVSMVAPRQKGSYSSYWMMENEKGELFGTGDSHDKPIWVKVEVK